MKIGKKIKYILGATLVTGIVTIPAAVSLIGCSDNKTEDDKNDKLNLFNESYNLTIDDKFSENLKNPEQAWNVPEDEYSIIKKITDSNFKGSIDYNNLSIEPMALAKNWLDNATYDDIANLLLINFNRNNTIYTGTYGNEFSRKNFIRVKVNNYDHQNHNVNFQIEVNRNESYVIQSSPNIDKYSSRISYKITYSFENITLVPTVINGLGLITIDTNNPSLKIKMIDYKCVDNPEKQWDAYYQALQNALKNNWIYMGRVVDQEYYDELIEEYQKKRPLNIGTMHTINSLVNSEWNKNDIIENDDYFAHLFSIYARDYDSFIGIQCNNDKYTYERDLIAKPNFIIAEFDNGNIKVIY